MALTRVQQAEVDALCELGIALWAAGLEADASGDSRRQDIADADHQEHATTVAKWRTANEAAIAQHPDRPSDMGQEVYEWIERTDSGRAS